MKSIVLKLECLSNLHVGSGDSNFNIIDNEVERDPITGYPTINASGVKGALRAHFEKESDYKGNCEEWFGSDVGQGKNGGSGCLKILAANMLAMPARATEGNKAYYLVSTSEMLDEFKALKNNLDFKARVVPGERKLIGENESISAEGCKLKKRSVFGEKTLYIIEEDEYKRISLPVIARNALEEGHSVNLWYEEIVPHESIFYVPIVCTDDKNQSLENFKEAIRINNIIQFGGNASIGEGLCKVTLGEDW
jgi:CRISPR-associated protein Cmr4